MFTGEGTIVRAHQSSDRNQGRAPRGVESFASECLPQRSRDSLIVEASVVAEPSRALGVVAMRSSAAAEERRPKQASGCILRQTNGAGG
jgi:hypothetical protein